MVGLWKNVLPGHIRAGLLLGLFAIGGILISAEAARRLAQNAAMVEATRAERRVSVLSGELARDLDQMDIQMRSLSVLFLASADVTQDELNAAEASVASDRSPATPFALAFAASQIDPGADAGQVDPAAGRFPIRLSTRRSNILSAGRRLTEVPSLLAAAERALAQPGTPILGAAFLHEDNWYAGIAISAHDGWTEGVLIGLLDVGRMFAELGGRAQPEFALEVSQVPRQEANAATRAEVIYVSKGAARGSEMQLQQEIHHGQVHWRLNWIASPLFLRPVDSLSPWLVGIAGGMITLLLTAILATLTFQNMLVRRQVLQRTEALTAALEQLEKASRAKSRFLSIVGHELRTPLNAIIGFGELFLNAERDPQARSHATFVVEAGRHLLGLVNDLLEVAHATLGTLELNRESCLPEHLVADAIEGCGALAERGGVALARQTVPVPPIRADGRRMRQALKSLCLNAIAASPRGATVSLSLDWDPMERLVNFTIRDSGRGLSREELQNASELFEQLEDPMTRRRQGLGIGLPLCRHIVELHGGKLTFKSVPGVGTEAIITLPVPPVDAKAAGDGGA